MSERKPPPRPPPPRQTTRTGQPTTQGKSLRTSFASVAIRFSNTSRDSDSEEEISIVRKAEETLPDGKPIDEVKNDNDKRQNIVVTQDRPEENNSVVREETNGCNERRRRPIQSKSLQEIDDVCNLPRTRQIKAGISKQQSWPAGKSINHFTEQRRSMKFLRGREQNSRSEASKIVSLSEKEETDAGSQPSTSHLQAVDSETKSNEPRSRSSSPFLPLNQQGHADGPTRNSGISLSSLLAAEKSETKWESDSDSEDTENFLDTFSEPPSSPECQHPVLRDSISETKKFPRSRVPEDKSPTFTYFSLCTLVTYIYFISTPPPFLSGMFTGVVLAYLAGCLFLWLFCPENTDQFQREMLEYEHRLANTPPLDYRSADPGLLLGIRELKGWMYKAYDYKPENFDFNSETTPIFASLKGTKLTLSHPNTRRDAKRFDPRTVEDNVSRPFSRHEFFDITDSSVSLLPPSLTMKRLWSRKFPICLKLGKPGAITEETSESDEEIEKATLDKMRSHKSFEDIGILYLFARTGREKEEWYNHFYKTLNPEKAESTSDLDAILRPSCSYPHYMASLLPLADSKLQSQQQAQIAWVNVLFGRAFWDVWQSRYWADKIRQRFQNKLSKTKKPQFIKDISIANLSLGHSLPIINGASPPVIDERGTWVDLDVTYSGGLIFTLEGHLNVEGYLRYFIDLGRGNSGDVAPDLEMADLQRKYELMEDEEGVQDGKDGGEVEQDEGAESESPPLSDSDFESPESDFDDFSSSACQSLPSSPLPYPNTDADVFQNAIEDSAETEDIAGRKDQNREMFFSTGSASELEEANRFTFDEPDDGKLLSPPSSPAKNTMDSNQSSPSRKVLDMSPKTGAKRKIFSMIERLAKSKWVKKAVETDIVKRAAEKFSNVPIILSVEVQQVKGTLALNIPPPPTNRLWYGFRGHPMLIVTARPKLGERRVKLTHVTDWIEKKLKQEFKNMFVLPNMEDLPIKLMNSGFEDQFPEH